MTFLVQAKVLLDRVQKVAGPNGGTARRVRFTSKERPNKWAVEVPTDEWEDMGLPQKVWITVEPEGDRYESD